jgi:pimeloyl-ACP methyl ester carboxylesterase
VFLHGLGSCADDWRYQISAFEASYRLLLVDLPGHYRSAMPPGPPGVDAMAAAVEDLLRERREPAAHVVGLSLGGCVALQLALRAPERVRSLTVVNAFARLRPAGVAAVVRLAVRLALLGTAPMPVVAAFVARGLFPDSQTLRAEATRSLARTSRRAYVAAMRALATFDARAALRAVRCPAMIVAGTRDGVVGVDAKEALARGIGGARYVVVPDAGHATNADAPRAFNAVLAEFIAAHGGE